MSLKNKIYFISDVHLGSPKALRSDQDKEDALIDFFRTIQADAEALYIVGDLFDFWFEYKSAISSTSLRVISELYMLVQSGIRVIYIPGNHDLWPGSVFPDQLGIELPGDPITVSHQNKHIYITHGDSFRTDFKYKFSRWVLKHPLAITLFRLLHPDLGTFFAHLTSHLSELRIKVADLKTFRHMTKTYMTSAKKIIDKDIKLVICGHYHHLQKIDIDTGTLVVLGDWMRYDSYAVLQDGNISIHQWRTAPQQYQNPFQEQPSQEQP